ncbi:MAG TPA: hypothetical protein VFI47_27800 [Acidimicrobiales bacterium]|nr:hypothetical protein [Acidimicrobiales bacterium]
MVSAEEWADEQARFASAYLGARAGAERRRVKLRWWSVPNGHRRGGAGKVTVLWSMALGNRFADHDIHVALYPADAPPGASPIVVFTAQPGDLVESQGRATGTVAGRPEPGGALVVETSRGAVLPASVPVAPGEGDPAWSETDGR